MTSCPPSSRISLPRNPAVNCWSPSASALTSRVSAKGSTRRASPWEPPAEALPLSAAGVPQPESPSTPSASPRESVALKRRFIA